MSASLLFYLLTSMPLCESTEYVTSNSLPAGTYKAVRRREGKVCPELPRLIDFELVVTDGERGQLATYSADIGGVGSVTGRRVTGIEEPAELVWYVEDTTRTVRSFGSLVVVYPPRCFHFEPKELAYNFLTALFPNLTRTARSTSEISSRLAFCPGKVNLIVGIEPERRDKRISASYRYGFVLQPNTSTNNAAVQTVSLRAAPVHKRRNLLQLVPEEAPAKVARGDRRALGEENGNSADVSFDVVSSQVRRGVVMNHIQGSTGSQPGLLGDPQGASRQQRASIHSSWSAEEHHTGTSAPSVDYGTTTVDGGDIDREQAAHQGSYSDEQLRTNAAETSGSSTLVTVPDGEYTARVDHFRKFTVDVRTDPQTHQRWVKLIVELCTFEWPVYFSKVLADSREGCLYLDYSNEDHSMETPLLLACLQAQTISWDSFRICQRGGGGWALMFNTESSNYTGAGYLNTSTIEIDLYRIGDSGQLE